MELKALNERPTLASCNAKPTSFWHDVMTCFTVQMGFMYETHAGIEQNMRGFQMTFTTSYVWLAMAYVI